MNCLVKDIPVYYEEFGAGRPLLTLHGRPTDHRHNVHDLEPLFEKRSGWRRLYPDLPGMGRTPGADWITRQDDVLEVVMGFMEAVAPGERFVVSGTSYGGYLARGLLHHLAQQIDGLLLIVPALVLDPEARILPAHQVIVEDAAFQAALAPDEQWLQEMVVVQMPAVIANFRLVGKPAAALADHEFLERSDVSFAFDTQQLPQPFPAPTLLITGRQDAACGFHAAWQLLNECPRGTLAILDRAGHFVGVEQQALLRALVDEWLDRVEEYAPVRGATAGA